MVLWYFWLYSFLGYLLEKAFAKATHARAQGRKGFLMLPLCPVYGLGMLAVLALPPEWMDSGWLVLFGGLAATAVEYGVHWLYDTVLHVQFWDYSAVRGNIHGRICPSFAILWGILTALAVHWVQPVVDGLARRVPPEMTVLVLLAFTADAVCSAWLLHAAGDPEILRADVSVIRKTPHP